MSLFGWMWIGYGLEYVGRFWLLSLDSVSFGNLTNRLIIIPTDDLNGSLEMALVFWAGACCMYRFGLGLGWDTQTSDVGSTDQSTLVSRMDGLSLVSLLAVSTKSLEEAVPASLLRPIGLVGSLWIIPSVLAWMQYDPVDPDSLHLRVRRWIYLIPGTFSFVLAPYRESLLAILMIPLVTKLFRGHRVRFAPVFMLAIAFMVAATVIVGAYREILWGGALPEDVVENVELTNVIDDPLLSPLFVVLRRFHSFDSLLLTTHLVPAVFPFEERNPLMDPLLEAFVPRALYPEKPESSRGLVFSVTIWQYGGPSGPEARIAPSIVGDLYSSGGIHWVIVGGLVWGLLIGLLERWKCSLPPSGQAIVVCALALLVAGGLERDFSRAVATLIQNGLVLYGTLFLLSRWVTVASPGHVDFESNLPAGRAGDLRLV